MNTQITINALLAYLIATDSYYAWYRYIHHTCQNNPKAFEDLELLLTDPNPQIIVYINTDDEYIIFKRVQGDPDKEDSSIYRYQYKGATFYIYFD